MIQIIIMSDNPTGLGYSNHPQAANDLTQQPLLAPTSQPTWLPASHSLQQQHFEPTIPLTSDGETAINNPTAITATLNAEAQAARERAMQIIRKFQATTDPFHNSSNVPRNAVQSNLQHPTEHVSDIASDARLFDPPEVYATKRQACLEKLRQREHAALLKNLQYLAQIEDARLQQRLEQIQQARDYEEHVNRQFRQRGRNRNRNTTNTNSSSGIGTDERRSLTRKTEKPMSSTADSVAIYVANLPCDGSVGEDLLRGLFSSYGNIRKVHFYLDKQTRKLKGDALVIYNATARQRNELVEAVCSQMNGCELPGGHTLLVQPSDPLHRLRKKATGTATTATATTTSVDTSHSHYGPAAAAAAAAATTSKVAISNAAAQDALNEMTGPEAEGDGGATKEPPMDDGSHHDGDDDDLDDFFSSL